MNVELLRKIAQVIQERPAEFDMTDWHTPAKCGTAHCIGGWAQILSGFGPEYKMNYRETAKLLDLRDEPYFDSPAHRLFFSYDWPAKFNPRKAKSAAARIEHFIATEGRE